MSSCPPTTQSICLPGPQSAPLCVKPNHCAKPTSASSTCDVTPGSSLAFPHAALPLSWLPQASCPLHTLLQQYWGLQALPGLCKALSSPFPLCSKSITRGHFSCHTPTRPSSLCHHHAAWFSLLPLAWYLSSPQHGLHGSCWASVVLTHPSSAPGAVPRHTGGLGKYVLP